MSFDEEWAAARTTAAANVSMRLNQAPGGGGSDLELNQDHIGAIGTEAHKLHARLQADAKHATTATAEAAGRAGQGGLRERGGPDQAQLPLGEPGQDPRRRLRADLQRAELLPLLPQQGRAAALRRVHDLQARRVPQVGGARADVRERPERPGRQAPDGGRRLAGDGRQAGGTGRGRP